MPIVTVVQPSDGQTADANDVNSQIDAILAVLNGFLDSANIATGGVTNANLAGGITVDKFATSALNGWSPLSTSPSTPSSVTYNGNAQYSLVFSGVDLTSILSPAMRLKLTRSVAAPTQCTSLNGTSQFYSKSSPAGMTFTDQFVISAWVKLSSYPSGGGDIVSRWNGTSGWRLNVAADGRVQLIGYNASSANFSLVLSTQSLPLNRWIHITAELNMLAFANGPTSSYIMFNGVDIPSVVSRSGTNPTSLIQAGNLEIGSDNAGLNPFPGKIAQAAIFNTLISQATMRSYMSQTFVGTESNLISAYSFNNTINDLNTTNANNLTANGSAVATNTDSPFASGVAAGLLEYGVVTAIVFSTNTTVTVQASEGGAVPTSGGVNAVSYSTDKFPFGLPGEDRFKISVYDATIAGALNSYVTANPADGIRYVNQGTAAGTMTLTQQGLTKRLIGTTGTISLAGSAQTTGTVTFPLAFTSIPNILGASGSEATTVALKGGVNGGISTAGVTVEVTCTTGGTTTGSALVTWIAEGQ